MNDDKLRAKRDLDALIWALFFHGYQSASTHAVSERAAWADRALEAFQQRFPDFPEAV